MYDVNEAVNAFRNLLEKQIKRVEKLKLKNEKSSDKSSLTIGFIDGDGIGPIIMEQAKKICISLLNKEISSGKIIIKNIYGLTIENRLKLNTSVPSETLEEIKKCDVILKGPTTTPKGGNLESANVTLRRELDLFSNVRPVVVKEKGIDWIFFRENTEGEYVLGSSGIELDGLALDFKVTTDEGTKRIAKAAFDYAKANGKNYVSIVTKANIMKKTDGKFSEVCHNIAKNYEGITVEDWYVDITAANLLNENLRSKFQVFLLPNLYGDIITDEAAEIQGGVGTAGSANIGEKYAIFEAIHGSAPRMIEAGLGKYANPSSILKALSMLLRHIGYSDKAQKLDFAIDNANALLNMSGEIGGNTADDFCNEILKFL